MRKILMAALVGTVLALGSNALAQDKVGANGGLLAGKDGHETELVITSSELTVYVIDGGKVESTKGASLKAIVQDAGKSTTIELANVGDTKLVGKLAAPLGKGAIIVLTGKVEHGHAIASRYVLK